MKKTALLLSALLGVSSLFAQDNPFKVSYDFMYANDHVFRGLEQAGNSLQPSIEVTVENIYAGFWTNLPVTKEENDEIDIYVGCKKQLTDHLAVDLLGTYYWYPEAGGGQTKDSYELGLGLSYGIGGFSISIYGYYDFRLESATVQASAGYSLPIKFGRFGASLDFNVFAGTVSARDWTPDDNRVVWDTGANRMAGSYKAKESYNYYGANLTLPYRLNDKALLHAGLHYATNDGIEWTDNKLWFTLGITLGF
ncbi:TorF family putative porin [Termitidicoccus mucosus]|uniref:Outer membrane protein beta-barrel domain-containing protein n=1 Tax=Termitidicoccus mucosus TaxID=1184151 RepID=A0A178IDP3_9BACT|nr:hypothetical protein AW736_23780 [Opitutaceae bacterium TSB47]